MICTMRTIFPASAHRDNLQCHAISVANGDIAEIDRSTSVAEGGHPDGLWSTARETTWAEPFDLFREAHLSRYTAVC